MQFDWVVFTLIVVLAFCGAVVVGCIFTLVYEAFNPVVNGVILAKRYEAETVTTRYDVALKMPMVDVVPEKYEICVKGYRKNGKAFYGWIEVNKQYWIGAREGDLYRN